MMFASSIVMADKLDIQDSTVLVIGKGQTNRNGLFVATDSIPVDSIFVDEIVLTYENRKADTLLIMDSTEGKIIFSNKVTNGMSKHEMESKCFSFMSGHTYVIRHGVKSWNLIIKNTCDRQDNVKGDSTTCTATSGGIIDEENKTDYSGLMWLIIGIVFGVVGCFVYYALSKRKKKRPVEGEIETGSIEEAGEGLDSSSIEKMDKQNDDDIKKLKDKANKPDRRLKQLTRIAKLLGLKNDQLDCIEREIKSLQEKAKYDNVKESEIDIKDKVANELFNQFGKLAIFSDLITRIKEERKSNIKYNDLLEFLKHLSGKDFYESFKGNESKSNAGYEEKSHTQWLKKCLKQKFNYEYDENKSVEKNLNFLIDSRIGKSGNVEEQPTDDKEALFAQRLEEEKGKWQQEVNQEKEEELNKKNEEIQELKNQLDNKESEVATLNQKISGKKE